MNRFGQILRALLAVERLPPPPEKPPRAARQPQPPRQRQILQKIFAVEKLPPPPAPSAGKAKPRPGGLGLFRALFAIEALPPYEAPPAQPKPAPSPEEAALFAWIEDLPLDSPEAPRRRLPLLRWLFWPERLGTEDSGNDEAR